MPVRAFVIASFTAPAELPWAMCPVTAIYRCLFRRVIWFGPTPETIEATWPILIPEVVDGPLALEGVTGRFSISLGVFRSVGHLDVDWILEA